MGSRLGFRRVVYDGKRMRKSVVRKTVDFNAAAMEYMDKRLDMRFVSDMVTMQPSIDYVNQLQLVRAYREELPAMGFTTKYVSTSINKIRSPINCALWTPDARRVITGTHSGEFTLWNGLTFNFETILQAHDEPIRSMTWSHNDHWMVSTDDRGSIKYWQISMNNVKAFVGHKEAIRDLSFAPTDAKFATASDDKLIGLWDFERCERERTLEGHHWDVKSVDWHPSKALLVSGSKDNLLKLWDPRADEVLTTLHGHKNTISRVRWNQNGNWFLSISRDQLIKLWDLRMLKTLMTFRGHKREVTAVAWHPQLETVFASGDYNGHILFWKVGHEERQAEICGAHDSHVWCLCWHPLGHLLVSGSNDHTTRWWTRNRPGDEMKDKYNANQLPEQQRKEAFRELHEAARLNPSRFGKLPAVLEGYDAADAAVHEEQEENEGQARTRQVIPGMGSAVAFAQRGGHELKRDRENQQRRDRWRDRDDRNRNRDRGRDHGHGRGRDRDHDRGYGGGGRGQHRQQRGYQTQGRPNESRGRWDR